MVATASVCVPFFLLPDPQLQGWDRIHSALCVLGRAVPGTSRDGCPAAPATLPTPIACLPTSWSGRAARAAEKQWQVGIKGQGHPWHGLSSDQRIPCWQRLGTAGKHLTPSGPGFWDRCGKSTRWGAQPADLQAPSVLYPVPRSSWDSLPCDHCTPPPRAKRWHGKEQPLSNCLVSGSLNTLKKYQGPQITFVSVSYMH